MSSDSWDDLPWDAWTDVEAVRARLAAGADPNASGEYQEPPLHRAALLGSHAVVAELAARVIDVDATHEGRTALWEAVHAQNGSNARVLQQAGADVLRPGLGGWTPWRLSLVSTPPDLLDDEVGLPGLNSDEQAAVDRARALISALQNIPHDGFSITCIPGLDVSAAMRRLRASSASAEVQAMVQSPWNHYDEADDSAFMRTIGLTAVPGGCMVSQPWGYLAAAPGVAALISPGRTCYSMYANPKSGNQGSIASNGVVVATDLHPGGGYPTSNDPAEEAFRSYMYRGYAAAYCYAFVGLEPSDSRAVLGPPDMWVELPFRDYSAIPTQT